MRPSSDIAFTETVKRIQEAQGSRSAYARMEQQGGWSTQVSDDLAAFISERDMFYFGTSNGKGQPYIQYRGGAPGFLKVLDSKTLGFADFSGNRQYISIGNLEENSKAFLFLIDYENQRRIKIWGRAKIIEDDQRLLNRLVDPQYPGRIERGITFTIDAWDVNCPQHIHRRILESKASASIKALQARIDSLEQELGSSKRELGSSKRELGSSKRELGSSKRELGSSKRELGSSKRELGSSKRELGSSKRELGSSKRELARLREKGSG